jgi:hypothetical protein
MFGSVHHVNVSVWAILAPEYLRRVKLDSNHLPFLTPTTTVLTRHISWLYSLVCLNCCSGADSQSYEGVHKSCICDGGPAVLLGKVSQHDILFGSPGTILTLILYTFPTHFKVNSN